MLPEHVEHIQSHAGYQLPTHVDAQPYRAGHGNNAQMPMQTLVPMRHVGSRTASSTTSGRRRKREILSSSREHICSECPAGFDTASDKAYVAKASYTRRTLSAMSATCMTLHAHTDVRILLAGILWKASSDERT
ncbi:hypothetical protein LTR27_010485 [Elasticomyces elasticus]|nr:hypothetical protein LTR27_010485 [Elasticomyces elasticus]